MSHGRAARLECLGELAGVRLSVCRSATSTVSKKLSMVEAVRWVSIYRLVSGYAPAA